MAEMKTHECELFLEVVRKVSRASVTAADSRVGEKVWGVLAGQLAKEGACNGEGNGNREDTVEFVSRDSSNSLIGGNYARYASQNKYYYNFCDE